MIYSLLVLLWLKRIALCGHWLRDAVVGVIAVSAGVEPWHRVCCLIVSLLQWHCVAKRRMLLHVLHLRHHLRRRYKQLGVTDCRRLEYTARLVKLRCCRRWKRITASSRSCWCIATLACAAATDWLWLGLDGNGHVCVDEARRVRLVRIVWLLDLSPTPCHSLEFFYL